MKLFAPDSVRVGMHRDKFHARLLPPLLYAGPCRVRKTDRNSMVFSPFEPQEKVHELLSQLAYVDSYVYAPGLKNCSMGNLRLRSTSLKGFHADVHDGAALICNAGFELFSESLSLGKRLLA